MSARLSSQVTVSALIRRVEGAGGHAMVLARGDNGGGAILIACAERGRVHTLLERTLTLDGAYAWTRCGPENAENPADFKDYLDRRRARDPDLWIVELDIAEAERFAAETIQPG